MPDNPLLECGRTGFEKAKTDDDTRKIKSPISIRIYFAIGILGLLVMHHLVSYSEVVLVVFISFLFLGTRGRAGSQGVNRPFAKKDPAAPSSSPFRTPSHHAA